MGCSLKVGARLDRRSRCDAQVLSSVNILQRNRSTQDVSKEIQVLLSSSKKQRKITFAEHKRLTLFAFEL